MTTKITGTERVIEVENKVENKVEVKKIFGRISA
jgi:hypothetical protein